MTAHSATRDNLFRAELVIRRATGDDAGALARLAALDSARPLNGDALVAFVHGEPWAAISLDDGRVIADPFRPSSIAAELVRVRARHMQDASAARSASGAVLRLRRASA